MASSDDALTINIKVSGASALDKLNRIISSTSDMKTVMDDVGKLTAQYAAGPVLASKGEAIGKTWAPWSDAYQTWRGKKGFGNQYLILTGKMSKSFAWNATDREVEVGNNTDYWPYLQFGTRKMPARPTVGFSDPLKRGIANKIQSYLQSRINGL